MINLIDTLLDVRPFINYESCTIHSDISLSEITGTIQNTDKCEYVSLPNYLDLKETKRRSDLYGNTSGTTYRTIINSTMCREIWAKLKIDNFIISKKLLNYFTDNKCNNYVISSLFNLKVESLLNRGSLTKVFEILTSKYNHLREGEGGYLIYGEKGNQIRYGKFINMILDTLYSGQRYPSQRQQEVERTVDIYKSTFSTSQYRVCVLSGDDIKLGYDRDYQSRSRDTMLGNSCMNDKLYLLKLYTVNPDKIYLFVITDEQGKIISRNLMWRLKKYNNFVFDRVYAIDNYIRKTVLDIALNENWIVYQEGRGIQEIFKLNDEGESKKIPLKGISIKLNFDGVHDYPYLDTFHHQRIWNKKLTNKLFSKFTYKYYNTGGQRSKIIW